MEKLAENILSWCENLEPAAMQQVQNLSKHPCLVGNVCLMPDAHCGYGMPIGGDSDTIAAMTGTITEAHYGIPDSIKQRFLDVYLNDFLKNLVDAFYKTVK